MRVTREDCNRIGLEAVAIFEAAKGLLAALFAVWLLPPSHRDLSLAAERIIAMLHLDPEARLANSLLHTAHKFAGLSPTTIFTFLSVYILIRFFEAYGLWHARAWAEWFALASGSLYLPFEIYHLIHRQTLFRWGLVLLNLAIVIYMAAIRWHAHKHRTRRETECPEEAALPDVA